MKYKVGDKVRIITKTKLKRKYYRQNGLCIDGQRHHFFFGSCCFRNEMIKHCGKIATIEGVSNNSQGEYIYRLDIDDGRWSWKEDMLFPIKEKKYITSFKGC